MVLSVSTQYKYNNYIIHYIFAESMGFFFIVTLISFLKIYIFNNLQYEIKITLMIKFQLEVKNKLN